MIFSEKCAYPHYPYMTSPYCYLEITVIIMQVHDDSSVSFGSVNRWLLISRHLSLRGRVLKCFLTYSLYCLKPNCFSFYNLYTYIKI